MITPEMLDEAEKIAKEATPGPYGMAQNGNRIIIRHNQGNTGRDYVAEISWAKTEGKYRFINTAKHFAHFNPEFCLKLIEKVKSLQEHILVSEKMLDSANDSFQSENKELWIDLKQSKEENESLRYEIERIKSVFLKSAEETQSQIDDLRAEMQKPKEEPESYYQLYKNKQAQVMRFSEVNESLRATLSSAREVIGFYSKDENLHCESDRTLIGITMSGGKRAREWLKENPK